MFDFKGAVLGLNHVSIWTSSSVGIQSTKTKHLYSIECLYENQVIIPGSRHEFISKLSGTLSTTSEVTSDSVIFEMKHVADSAKTEQL